MCDQQRLRPACAYAQSDQSLCLSLEYSMSVMPLTGHHLEFLSLKGSCSGPSESTLVKMPHCWKSHAMAQIMKFVTLLHRNVVSLMVHISKSTTQKVSLTRKCHNHSTQTIPPHREQETQSNTVIATRQQGLNQSNATSSLFLSNIIAKNTMNCITKQELNTRNPRCNIKWPLSYAKIEIWTLDQI